MLDTRIFLFEKCIRYSVDIVSQTALLVDTVQVDVARFGKQLVLLSGR